MCVCVDSKLTFTHRLSACIKFKTLVLAYMPVHQTAPLYMKSMVTFHTRPKKVLLHVLQKVVAVIYCVA